MRYKNTLLGEADEYVNSIYELARNQNGMYTQVQVRQAYIDGKKSMQEEITELKKQIEKMKSDVMRNVKWADQNKNEQMYCKLNAMFNQWEIKENA